MVPKTPGEPEEEVIERSMVPIEEHAELSQISPADFGHEQVIRRRVGSPYTSENRARWKRLQEKEQFSPRAYSRAQSRMRLNGKK